MFKNLKTIAAAALLTLAATPALAQTVAAPKPTPAPVMVPYFTTTLTGRVTWDLVNAMATNDSSTMAKIAKKRKAAPVANQLTGADDLVAIELTTAAGRPGMPGGALVTLTDFGVQFTAPATITVVAASDLLGAVRGLGRFGLPVGDSLTLLKSAPAVKFYGYGIGDAKFFAVGVPENQEADAMNRGLTAPAASAPLPALSDTVMIDLGDQGNVAFGRASQ